ncbi:hypothetical protein IKE84_02210 [Candidatus Saccharibacteria bacterium]|nr:hypothetical protein [Candidatus Saccharibacteria bacterium]
MNRKNDKQAWVSVPDWFEQINDIEIESAIFALLFSWNFDGPEKIDNLREYLEQSFPDMTKDKIEKVANLLIEHKLVVA